MRNILLLFLLFFTTHVNAIERDNLFTMSDLAEYGITFDAEFESIKETKRLFLYELVTYKYKTDKIVLTSTLQKTPLLAVNSPSLEQAYSMPIKNSSSHQMKQYCL